MLCTVVTIVCSLLALGIILYLLRPFLELANSLLSD